MALPAAGASASKTPMARSRSQMRDRSVAVASSAGAGAAGTASSSRPRNLSMIMELSAVQEATEQLDGNVESMYGNVKAADDNIKATLRSLKVNPWETTSCQLYADAQHKAMFAQLTVVSEVVCSGCKAWKRGSATEGTTSTRAVHLEAAKQWLLSTTALITQSLSVPTEEPVIPQNGLPFAPIFTAIDGKEFRLRGLLSQNYKDECGPGEVFYCLRDVALILSYAPGYVTRQSRAASEKALSSMREGWLQLAAGHAQDDTAQASHRAQQLVELGNQNRTLKRNLERNQEIVDEFFNYSLRTDPNTGQYRGWFLFECLKATIDSAVPMQAAETFLKRAQNAFVPKRYRGDTPSRRIIKEAYLALAYMVVKGIEGYVEKHGTTVNSQGDVGAAGGAKYLIQVVTMLLEDVAPADDEKTRIRTKDKDTGELGKSHAANVVERRQQRAEHVGGSVIFPVIAVRKIATESKAVVPSAVRLGLLRAGINPRTGVGFHVGDGSLVNDAVANDLNASWHHCRKHGVNRAAGHGDKNAFGSGSGMKWLGSDVNSALRKVSTTYRNGTTWSLVDFIAKQNGDTLRKPERMVEQRLATAMHTSESLHGSATQKEALATATDAAAAVGGINSGLEDVIALNAKYALEFELCAEIGTTCILKWEARVEKDRGLFPNGHAEMDRMNAAILQLSILTATVADTSSRANRRILFSADKPLSGTSDLVSLRPRVVDISRLTRGQHVPVVVVAGALEAPRHCRPNDLPYFTDERGDIIDNHVARVIDTLSQARWPRSRSAAYSAAQKTAAKAAADGLGNGGAAAVNPSPMIVLSADEARKAVAVAMNLVHTYCRYANIKIIEELIETNRDTYLPDALWSESREVQRRCALQLLEAARGQWKRTGAGEWRRSRLSDAELDTLKRATKGVLTPYSCGLLRVHLSVLHGELADDDDDKIDVLTQLPLQTSWITHLLEEMNKLGNGDDVVVMRSLLQLACGSSTEITTIDISPVAAPKLTIRHRVCHQLQQHAAPIAQSPSTLPQALRRPLRVHIALAGNSDRNESVVGTVESILEEGPNTEPDTLEAMALVRSNKDLLLDENFLKAIGGPFSEQQWRVAKLAVKDGGFFSTNLSADLQIAKDEFEQKNAAEAERLARGKTEPDNIHAGAMNVLVDDWHVAVAGSGTSLDVEFDAAHRPPAPQHTVDTGQLAVKFNHGRGGRFIVEVNCHHTTRRLTWKLDNVTSVQLSSGARGHLLIVKCQGKPEYNGNKWGKQPGQTSGIWAPVTATSELKEWTGTHATLADGVTPEAWVVTARITSVGQTHIVEGLEQRGIPAHLKEVFSH